MIADSVPGPKPAGTELSLVTSLPTLEPTMRYPASTVGPRAKKRIEKILDATREVFLTYGYAGTSVDEIARTAGVSRPSFYTYFPTKRDALLALGAGARGEMRELIASLRGLGPEWTFEELRAWTDDAFDHYERYGSVALAWREASHEDEELRVAGMNGTLATCRRLGQTLDELRGRPEGDPRAQGLVVMSMLLYSWSQARLYEPVITRDDVVTQLARSLAAQLLAGVAEESP